MLESLQAYCAQALAPLTLLFSMEDDQIGQLLSGFTELRKEVLKQQAEAYCFLARRMRAGDNQHVFKRAGNEAQFKFTTRLLDHIQGVKNA